jgi:hypothetical protein
MFFTKKGKLMTYKVTHDKKKPVIYVRYSGKLPGFQPILSEERYPASAAMPEKLPSIFPV